MSSPQPTLSDYSNGGSGEREDGGFDDVWELFNVVQNPLYENPALIRRLHVHELLEQKETAELLGCGRSTLQRKLKKYGIKRPWRDEDVLWELYWEENYSTREIAEVVGCGASTVKRKLRQKDILLRPSNRDLPYAPLELNTSGYEQWRTHTGDRQAVYAVHRLLAVAKYGVDAVEGMHVHHKNGLQWDNRPGNIELMTASDHAKHHHTNK